MFKKRLKNRMDKVSCLFTCVVIFIIGILYLHNVPKTITAEDMSYIKKITTDAGYNFDVDGRQNTFETQIMLIKEVQSSAFHTTPQTQPIPKDRKREPRDVYEFNAANCSDRSRYMDKALRAFGLQTRYASLYSVPEGYTALQAVLTPANDKVHSHALIEVKTEKGWIFVDSVTPWIALDAKDEPVSLDTWQNQTGKTDFEWMEGQAGELYPLLTENFTYIYGLYSRHGRFYPPYTPVPDVNWLELLENF